MIAGLDSATPPTATQVAAARAAGVRLWSGYLATMPGVNLLRPWSQAEFEVARGCGSTPIAFCSGWDDPLACRARAGAWNVRLCLDVEDGIRPDGPWVQPWLDASGAGLYGLCAVHWGRTAAFHVVARYPGGAYAPEVWDPMCPVVIVNHPRGWQAEGSHQEFGADVDRGWYDDWFGGDILDQATFNRLMDGYLGQAGMGLADLDALRWRVETILSNAPQVPSGPTAGEINVLAKALAPPTGASAAQLAAALRAAAHQLDGQ